MDTTTLVVALAFLTLLVVLAVGVVSKKETHGNMRDGDDRPSAMSHEGRDEKA